VKGRAHGKRTWGRGQTSVQTKGASLQRQIFTSKSGRPISSSPSPQEEGSSHKAWEKKREENGKRGGSTTPEEKMKMLRNFLRERHGSRIQTCIRRWGVKKWGRTKKEQTWKTPRRRRREVPSDRVGKGRGPRSPRIFGAMKKKLSQKKKKKRAKKKEKMKE